MRAALLVAWLLCGPALAEYEPALPLPPGWTVASWSDPFRIEDGSAWMELDWVPEFAPPGGEERLLWLGEDPAYEVQSEVKETKLRRSSFLEEDGVRELHFTRAGAALRLRSSGASEADYETVLGGLSARGLVRELVGRSVQGREIHVTRMGSGEDVTLFFGVFHGDEPAGKYLLERLLEHLAGQPHLLEDRRLLVCPVLNPDGLAAGTRWNANGVDLNRNFPARNWSPEGKGDRYWGGPAPASEPETVVVMELLERFRPDRIVSIHAPLHNVNYDGPAQELARVMALHNGYPVEPDIGYPTPGSFGTFAGRERRIPTITLELPEGPEERLWETNRRALLEAFLFGR